MKPIPFWSFGGYRRWCKPWWQDLWRTVTVGWIYDIRTYWRRARYGWAPSDTMSLDTYLNRVLAGSLRCLAENENANGAPTGYPDLHPTSDSPDPDFEQWKTDLLRWSAAFEAAIRDDYMELHGDDIDARVKDVTARRDAVHQALKELEPWWDALWD